MVAWPRTNGLSSLIQERGDVAFEGGEVEACKLPPEPARAPKHGC